MFVTKCTCKPDSSWVREQAEAFVEHVKDRDPQITLLMRDRDGIYGQKFDQVIREAGIKVKKTSVRAPNLQCLRGLMTAITQLVDQIQDGDDSAAHPPRLQMT